MRKNSAEKNRLFNEAGAAWDKGGLRLAFTLFMQAAELGDRASQLDLGYFFDNGLFVKKDKRKRWSGIAKLTCKPTQGLRTTWEQFIGIWAIQGKCSGG